MPLHPQLAALIAESPPPWCDVETIRATTPASARASLEEAATDRDLSVPPGVLVEDVELPGADGPLHGRVTRPGAGAPAGTILWIRGGGFVLGSLETDTLAAPLALASGCAVVSVEYRLAPEHPFPAGLEDCYAALRWSAEHAERLDGRAGPVAVGGESAGGNLAAAVALMARDRGGPQLALQVLLVPMTARVFDGPSRHDPAVGAEAHPEGIEWIWRHYLAREEDGASPLASPLHADTLAGLPPAVVITAEYDVLRDEGEAYARRLAREGVPVEQRRYDGMAHGLGEAVGAIDAADECVAYMGAAFRRALSAPASA